MADPMQAKLQRMMDGANQILDQLMWMPARITRLGFHVDDRMMSVQIAYKDDEGTTIISRAHIVTAFANVSAVCEAACRAFLSNADEVMRADWGLEPEEPGRVDWDEVCAEAETDEPDADADELDAVPQGATIQ